MIRVLNQDRGPADRRPALPWPAALPALIAQPDVHGLAGHLLKWVRVLATAAVALPLVAMTFIMFESAHPTHLPPALWTAVGAGAAIAVTLSAVCLTSWRRQREQKVVCSPWEQNRAREDVPKRPESFEEAENKYGYRKAAMRVDSAEGWHTDFLWDQQAEDELIASLSRQDSAYHAFITSMPDRETWIYAGSGA